MDYQDSGVTSKSVLYLLIYPTSFFFSIFYTESLFLFLSIATVYYARKKQWLAASILGFFLTLTRSVGFVIMIPLLIEYFGINFDSYKISIKKLKKDILYLLLVPAGLLIYMAYLYYKFGDPLAFSHAQTAWGRGLVSVFTTLQSYHLYSAFYKILFLGSIGFALIMIVYLIFSKARFSYIAYSAVLMFFYLSTNKLEAIPRLISVVFPLYIGMAVLGNKYKIIDQLFTYFLIMLLTLCTILFVNGYWFT
jgi:hypothetical protein